MSGSGPGILTNEDFPPITNSRRLRGKAASLIATVNTATCKSTENKKEVIVIDTPPPKKDQAPVVETVVSAQPAPTGQTVVPVQTDNDKKQILKVMKDGIAGMAELMAQPPQAPPATASPAAITTSLPVQPTQSVPVVPSVQTKEADTKIEKTDAASSATCTKDPLVEKQVAKPKRTKTDEEHIFQSLQILGSMTKAQKLWTYEQSYRLVASEAGFSDPFVRYVSDQSRTKNLDDLRWLFHEAFDMMSVQLEERERCIQYLRTNQIKVPEKYFRVDPIGTKTGGLGTAPTIGTTKTETEEVKVTVPVPAAATLLGRDDILLKSSNGLTRNILNNIVTNTLTITRIQSTLCKARQGLEEMKHNSDYSGDPNTVAGIECLQQQIDLMLQQTEVQLTFLVP